MWKPNKICYDSTEYESIDKINFFVFEEKPTPGLDIDEIENVLCRENAVPIVDDSLRKYLIILSIFVFIWKLRESNFVFQLVYYSFRFILNI